MIYLNVLLELGLMLTGQLLVLPLEFGDEDLPLDLLLLLQGQQLLLQLLLSHRGRHRAPAGLSRPSEGARRVLGGRGKRGHLLLLLLVMVHTQVHGDGSWRETQGQRRVDVHCEEGEERGVKQQRCELISIWFGSSVNQKPQFKRCHNKES